MAPAKKPATVADLLALPDDVRAELWDGELTFLPPPMPEHGRAQMAVAGAIGCPFDLLDAPGGPGGWWILTAVDVALLGQVVRPDLAGWRRERLPNPWGLRPVDVVPDWICEVVSPSNASTDRVSKRRLYARAGVAHYWLVDPAARTLEALALAGGAWTEVGAFGDDDVARVPPFEAVELEVTLLFPPRELAAGEPR